MKTKSVKMEKTRHGSPDGVTVLLYERGQTYDMPEELADVYLGNGDGVPGGEDELEPERKEAAGPAENKQLGGPDQSKAGDGEGEGGEGGDKPVLSCQHLGFGKWQVVDAEGNVVSDGMSLDKAQAHAWAESGERPDGV